MQQTLYEAQKMRRFCEIRSGYKKAAPAANQIARIPSILQTNIFKRLS